MERVTSQPAFRRVDDAFVGLFVDVEEGSGIHVVQKQRGDLREETEQDQIDRDDLQITSYHVDLQSGANADW